MSCANGTPHSWHELTQFSSKIFRHVHLYSAVNVHEHSIYFWIIRYDVTLLFMFTTEYYIMGKWWKIGISILKGPNFHPISLNRGYSQFFKCFFVCSLQSKIADKHPFTNLLPPLKPSCSKCHPPLNACTTLHIMISNCKKIHLSYNVLRVLPLFSHRLGEITQMIWTFVSFNCLYWFALWNVSSV